MGSRRRALIGLALAVTAGCALAAGLTAPSVEFTRFFILTDRHSILSVIAGLWTGGEVLLAVVLGLFSVAFPTLKVITLTFAGASMTISGRHPRRLLAMSAALGRWSMLDVMVLALVIFYVKQTGLARAASLPGIWYFAGAVVLTIISAMVLSRK
ncbi:MAG: paraquat-inducible protein A [Rhodobiaceae bacterium]|nr:paraquat-inducible protein A [Rhodobiaceae bacterium]